MEQWSLAGPTIVNRITPILQNSSTPPLRLCLITFANEAQDESKERNDRPELARIQPQRLG